LFNLNLGGQKMKKILFVFVVLIFALGAGCKRKVEPVAPPPPPKISEAQFLLGLSERTDVKNLKLGDSLVIALNPDVVLSPSAQSVVVKPFDADLNYYELLALVKKLPLTVVNVLNGGSQLLIRNYFELKDFFNSTEKFRILEPMPAYYLKVGTKEYWVGKEGKFWKTW